MTDVLYNFAFLLQTPES